MEAVRVEDTDDGRCPKCGEDGQSWEPGDGGGAWVFTCDCEAEA